VSFSQKGIVGIGHVLLDGIGVASESYLLRYGNLQSPAHVSSGLMEEFLKALEEDRSLLSAPMFWSAGGGITIMGKASRALGLEVDIWACIGNDARGDLLENELTSLGIRFHSATSKKPTGIFCSLAISGGGKRIIVSPGAARDIRGFNIPDEVFVPGKILYIDGLLINSRQWLGELATKAKANDMKVAFDLSTPGNARRFAAEIVDFSTSCCDYVFANEEEFKALAPVLNCGSSSSTRWVVKRGSQGAYFIHGNSRIEAEARKTEAVDDTGAGDAFAAGFLYGVLEGLDDMECLSMGNSAGSIAVNTRGSNFDSGKMRQTVEMARRIT